ncbi:MAG: DUF4837 family protein, partial [Bacteroidetes bacterium]|nr:DUF4837 family protein [Bacteroidota bacterium]
MMRVTFLLASLLFLFSCGNSKTKTATMVSHGMPGEVLIIAQADEQVKFLLDSGIGGPQAGLNPPEPRYRCALLHPEEAVGDALGAALIILVKNPNVQSKQLNALWTEAGERATRKSGISVAKDVWAKGQFVFLVEAASEKELHALASAQSKLADVMFESECAIGLYGGLLPNKYSDSVMNRVEGDFGFRFPLPPQFRLVQSNKEMLWFIWEGRDF